jgi:photosystem II stability/assembly factor-like uncharacterized protein
MPNFRTLFASVLFCAFASVVSAQWIKQNVNTTASFRGLSVVNEKIVWASGTGGTVIRTIDGGKTWNVMTVPGAEKLDFRDIEAFDANTAYILSIGNGESSRIYKTADGGKSWQLEFQNKNEKAFFDAIACWDREHCLAMSDPVEGKFIVLTRSPGRNNGLSSRALNWSPSIYGGPAAFEGEAAFAASGTCLTTHGKTNAFIVTGGSKARVLRSTDNGATWTSADTPIIHGTPGSGIFSIAMSDDKNGITAGGDYEKPTEVKDNLALTHDGGKTWTLQTGLNGYRSGVAYIDKDTVIAVGTSGTDISRDSGKTWKTIGDENLNSVQAKGKTAVWAVGPKGLVVKLK